MAMVLPKFDDPNPTAEYLRQEQSRLKIQADKMMAQTKIMDVFSRHGKLLEIGGSYKYNLMVYPDLDIEFIPNKVDKASVASLLADIAKQDEVRGVQYADRANFPSQTPGRPIGYWIGTEIPFEGDSWGIDCWLQENSQGIFINDYSKRLTELDQQTIDAILSIKYHLIYKGLYGKKFLSAQVYDAVLDDGIRTTEQFLNKMRSTLSS